MHSFFKTFLRTGPLFGILMALFYSFQNGWKIGLWTGLVAGLVFGLSMTAFVAYQSRKFTQDRPLLPGEKLVKEGPANHKRKREAAGGWIYLTDARLFFVAHKANFDRHELSIPLAEIESVEKTRSLWVIPNKLLVKLKNGATERFVVDGVKDWVETIEERI